jgi:hypothetical protein
VPYKIDMASTIISQHRAEVGAIIENKNQGAGCAFNRNGLSQGKRQNVNNHPLLAESSKRNWGAGEYSRWKQLQRPPLTRLAVIIIGKHVWLCIGCNHWKLPTFK